MDFFLLFLQLFSTIIKMKLKCLWTWTESRLSKFLIESYLQIWILYYNWPPFSPATSNKFNSFSIPRRFWLIQQQAFTLCECFNEIEIHLNLKHFNFLTSKCSSLYSAVVKRDRAPLSMWNIVFFTCLAWNNEIWQLWNWEWRNIK